MVLIISILILILSLLACMTFHLDMIYGLLVGMAAFMTAAVWSGFALKDVLRMMWKGVRDSFIVIGVLLIIGAMTGIWRGCGTVQLLVVYGTELIHPKLFILFSFLLPMGVSYLIGTSFGTSATIGAVMMTLCSMSGADPLLTAGAVMSGIFFGDRASPASSCAHLNAYLTGTEIYRNVKLMLRDCIPATLITIGLYTVLSFLNPLKSVDTHILSGLREQFVLTPLLLIPAAIILIAPLVRMNIKAAMGISILCASLLAVFIQKMPVLQVLRILLTGFEAEGELRALLSGGGVTSMVHSCIMIMISATYSGIFNGTHMLSGAENMLERLSRKLSPFRITALTSLPLIMFSCNQTLALMLHSSLIRPLYEKKGISRDQMMLDLSNTTVVFSALIPWCLAASMPLEVLHVSPACLPLAFYLYVPALVALGREKLAARKPETVS